MNNDNIALFPSRPAGDNSGSGGHTGGGNPPGGDDMERRVQALESAIPDMRERLVRIETNMDHMATKADIEAVNARIEAMGRTTIQWTIATAVVLAGVAFTAARFIPGGPVG